MTTPWSEHLCAPLYVKYDKGQVCICVKSRNNLMFGISLKNANNEKTILINMKRVKSRSRMFQAMNCQVQFLYTVKKIPTSSFIILGWEVP